MPKGIQGFQKGHGFLGNNESKKKMSQNSAKFWLGKKRDSPEYIKKISEAHKGQHSSPNTEFKKTGVIAYSILGGVNAYRNLHKWVEKKLGKSDVCEHCKKEGFYGKQIHWANKSNEYRRNITDWIRLCVKCHYHYDLHRQIKLT